MPRPRKYPAGAAPSPAERTAAYRAALAASGGRQININLRAAEAAALDRLRAAGGYATDREAVVAAIVSQAART